MVLKPCFHSPKVMVSKTRLAAGAEAKPRPIPLITIEMVLRIVFIPIKGSREETANKDIPTMIIFRLPNLPIMKMAAMAAGIRERLKAMAKAACRSTSPRTN
ncbi:hypothetical protein SDC9_176375 [bioreactor metagenome]|uniref:Uncharacterized protein n=1 Tax=bioreactor metagenome TaxID=1076179 RepID=A0A645GT01_9ZZZZ